MNVKMQDMPDSSVQAGPLALWGFKVRALFSFVLTCQ